MAELPPIPIPHDFVGAAEHLAVSQPDTYRALLVVLEDDQVQEMSRAGLITDIAAATGWDTGIAEALLEMRLSLRRASAQVPARQLASLAGSVSRAPNITVETDRAVLAHRLEGLLGSRSVVLLARASDLLSEHEHVLGELRILSDIRPLFDPEDAEQLHGATISHVLRLGLIGQNPSLIHIALDEQDLANIQAVISRARQKTKRLSEAVKEMRIPLIIPYERPRPGDHDE